MHVNPMACHAFLGLTALVMDVVVSADGVQSDWPHVHDKTQTVKYAALGLFSKNFYGTGIKPVIGEVSKHPSNPLFEQDKPWEPRLDNAYPNIEYNQSTGVFQLWYGGCGAVASCSNQFLEYANSTDGLSWSKPNLGRYNLSEKFPSLSAIGKENNIIMFGGGLGVYRDPMESDPQKLYKISGGSPGGCYSEDGSSDCLVATAASPDGINNWTDVTPLVFPKPWRPDCHTNIVYDNIGSRYLMTTRDYIDERMIAISASGSTPKRWKGNWSLLYSNEYPPAQEAAPCLHLPADVDPVKECGSRCRLTDNCAFFWVYTAGNLKGDCFLKSAILPGSLMKPACPECGGEFYKMDGSPAPVSPTNHSTFGSWGNPVLVEKGSEAQQLYSQITIPFYDIFLGIVMVFDAETGSIGPNAGHVHCRLAWSNSALANWSWVDEGGLTGKEFIPAGALGTFDSHVCFAAHLPIKLSSGEIQLYYMGGNGPHSGLRNTSFGLATTGPDRFAGVGGSGSIESRSILVTGSTLIITADVFPAGSISIYVNGASSLPIRENVTDTKVAFTSSPGLSPGSTVVLKFGLDNAVLYSIGFTP